MTLLSFFREYRKLKFQLVGSRIRDVDGRCPLCAVAHKFYPEFNSKLGIDLAGTYLNFHGVELWQVARAADDNFYWDDKRVSKLRKLLLKYGGVQ